MGEKQQTPGVKVTLKTQFSNTGPARPREFPSASDFLWDTNMGLVSIIEGENRVAVFAADEVQSVERMDAATAKPEATA